MYLTGTKDTNVKPADVKAAYDASPQQKIFANGRGFNHMAPLNKPVGNGRWDLGGTTTLPPLCVPHQR